MYNDRKKTLLLIALGFVIVFISIAYAALATNLSIGGTANTPSVDWDIHFLNFSSSSTPVNTTLGETNTGEIKSVTTSGTSITGLKAELKKPGDSIVYTFDIKNFGSISANLDSFSTNITCQNNNCNHATYSVVCLDSSNNTFTQNETLNPNAVLNCTLTLKFKDDATIEDDVSADISANWSFSQN